MEKEELKQKKKFLFSLIKKAEERLENASVILDREANMDAVPILYKGADIIIQALLQYKQIPSSDFSQNLQSLKHHYQDQNFPNKAEMESLNSLQKMNKEYLSQTQPELKEEQVRDIFHRTEDLMEKAYKFFKTQLATPEEIKRKQKIKKSFLYGGLFLGFLLVIFLLVRLGLTLFGPQHGLLAYYYDNIHLKPPPSAQTVDRQIDFHWGTRSAHSKIIGNFSARWTGRIKIKEANQYTFYVESDEGVRLFVDNEVVIDTWQDKDRKLEHSGDIYLEEGYHPIKLEYFFNQRHATLTLLWSSPSFSKKRVGSKVLFPPTNLNSST